MDVDIFAFILNPTIQEYPAHIIVSVSEATTNLEMCNRVYNRVTAAGETTQIEEILQGNLLNIKHYIFVS